MKLKIKVKLKNNDITCMPKSIGKGDWIDLCAAEDIDVDNLSKEQELKFSPLAKYDRKKFSYCIIPLGVAIKLPDGYEAIISPRSSIFKNYNIIMPNSIGIIDNSYSGNEDYWGCPVLAFGKGIKIKKGERLCQFRIQLSQKATAMQKIKNLFYNEVGFEIVSDLGNMNRGGFGSTGKKEVKE